MTTSTPPAGPSTFGLSSLRGTATDRDCDRLRFRRSRLCALVALLVQLRVTAFALPAVAAPLADSTGATIYRTGLLPDGKAVEANRTRLPSLQGADAACVRCHRRSGLGSSEGPFAIPPITARFLAEQREESRLSADSQIAPGYHVGRAAYTDATLARAIRDGVVPGGGQLGELMPRYRIDDAAMASLLAYLEALDHGPAPGFTADAVHFATIVAPDVDVARRQAMLDVLGRYAAAPNPIFGAPRKALHPNRMVGYRSGSQQWVLHVWELSGKPSTWERQLVGRLAADPVFAVLSGIGGREWGPVHRFCERSRLPCILPNVALPVPAETDFYSVYFSKGVLLEAALAAHWLGTTLGGKPPERVVQVYRRGDIGAVAARAVRASITSGGMRVLDRPLDDVTGTEDWDRQFSDLESHDALVLWLRSSDLRSLPSRPPPGTAILVSGLMGDWSASALPVAWQGVVRMVYPADLPDRAAERSAQPKAWLMAHKVPIVDEAVQIDTYVACAAMSEVLGSLFDNSSRELLVERFEDMLGAGANSGRYPSLGLAQGQHFASKGGYIVRFDMTKGARPIAEGDWSVP